MDTEKLRQAVIETAITFAAAFLLSFAAWVQGWATLPDVGAAVAALKAAIVAGAVATSKGVVWYLTGTKA